MSWFFNPQRHQSPQKEWQDKRQKDCKFQKETKSFCALLVSSRCTGALNLINMAQDPESCKKLLDMILEKLVSTKHSSVGDKCKQEYALFLCTTVEDAK